MENWGNNRGYNNSSGFLYTMQGMLQAGRTSKEQLSFINNGMKQTADNSVLPTFTVSQPNYSNDTNKSFMLKYMNDGLEIKQKGVKRLKLPADVEQAGGEVSMKDYNTI